MILMLNSLYCSKYILVDAVIDSALLYSAYCYHHHCQQCITTIMLDEQEAYEQNAQLEN